MAGGQQRQAAVACTSHPLCFLFCLFPTLRHSVCPPSLLLSITSYRHWNMCQSCRGICLRKLSSQAQQRQTSAAAAVRHSRSSQARQKQSGAAAAAYKHCSSTAHKHCRCISTCGVARTLQHSGTASFEVACSAAQQQQHHQQRQSRISSADSTTAAAPSAAQEQD